MVATAVMLLAVGALTSQLAATRRQAASYAAWFLGASYAVRMIADAGVGLHALMAPHFPFLTGFAFPLHRCPPRAGRLSGPMARDFLLADPGRLASSLGRR